MTVFMRNAVPFQVNRSRKGYSYSVIMALNRHFKPFWSKYRRISTIFHANDTVCRPDSLIRRIVRCLIIDSGGIRRITQRLPAFPVPPGYQPSAECPCTIAHQHIAQKMFACANTHVPCECRNQCRAGPYERFHPGVGMVAAPNGGISETHGSRC